MVRLGLVSPADSAIGESHRVVDATIRATTTTGAGWHRYNSDGYGDRASDGRPWAPSGQGTGHLWPVLAGERGEYDVANGDATSALSLLAAMRDGASGVGLIPEQVWELPDLVPSPFGTDPTVASIGFQNGGAAGSASPLTLSAAQYVRLIRDTTTGRLLERPANAVSRYVDHQQGQTSLAVIAPPHGSAASGSPAT